MSYQVLARKWRPHSFSKVVGQQHIVQPLAHALDNDRLHHAFLFTGTRGVGKTTIARILAKSLNCEEGVSSTPCGKCSTCQEVDAGRFVDLIEVDAASRTGVDDTRELLNNVQYTPTRGRYKVYLIDEIHMFSNHSFNALLKTLEEPPAHVKFLLATTDPQKLPITILSRCLQFNLKRLEQGEISDYLATLLKNEDTDYQQPALDLLAIAADGSIRDGLSLLDQAISYGDGKVITDDVKAMLGTVEREQAVTFLSALVKEDGELLLNSVTKFAQYSTDFSGLLTEIISTLHKIAVLQQLPEQREDDLLLRELADNIAPDMIQLYYQIAILGRRDLPLAPSDRDGLEMVMLRMLAFNPASIANRAVAGRRQPKAATAAVTPQSKSAETYSQQLQVKVSEESSWEEIVAQLPLTGMPAELASNAIMLSFKNNKIILSLQANKAILKNQISEQKLVSALQNIFGKELQVAFEIDKVGDVNNGQATPAKIKQDKLQLAKQSTLEAIKADPQVQEIVSTFNARIDESSIEPTTP